MARPPHQLRRAASPQFVAPPVGAGSSSMADIPIRVDPDMPKDTIVFEDKHGTQVGAITNLATPIQFPQYDSSLALDSVSVEDIDQLWDWVRADRQGTTNFLGQTHANSQSFHKQIGDVILAERQNLSWFRAVRSGGSLAGFALVAISPNAGVVGIYLETAQRGLLKDVIVEVAEQHPRMALMCITPDQALANIFVEAGFTSQYVVTRPPSGVRGVEAS